MIKIITQEEKKKILQERAKKLAQPEETKVINIAKVEVVEFLLAHEIYAVESRYVQEVCQLKEFTPLPGTPPFIFGLINFRGIILTVIDLRSFFMLPQRGLTGLNKVIIVQTADIKVGILADAIQGISYVHIDEFQPPLPTMTGIRREYIKGITGERLIVLDMEKLLLDQRIVVNEEVD
jgi:purine-binding chemotaxis protein CheW